MEDVKEIKKIALFFGGKSLTGTKKQKEWAEGIRKNILTNITEEQAIMLCDKKGLCNHSKFWIENRFKKPCEFGCFIEKQKKLLSEYYKADCKVKKEISEKYNILTKEWFKNE